MTSLKTPEGLADDCSWIHHQLRVLIVLRILAGTISDSVNVVLEPGHRLELAAQISGRVGRLIVSVHEFQEVPPDCRSRNVRRLSPSELESACAVIRAKHTQAVRLAEIAAVVGLSPSQFSRSFRVSMGMTLTAYTLRVRLETAMHLMQQTRSSLSDIALNSGFSDQSTFSRMFVRTHHITPSRWRIYKRMLAA